MRRAKYHYSCDKVDIPIFHLILKRTIYEHLVCANSLSVSNQGLISAASTSSREMSLSWIMLLSFILSNSLSNLAGCIVTMFTLSSLVSTLRSVQRTAPVQDQVLTHLKTHRSAYVRVPVSQDTSGPNLGCATSVDSPKLTDGLIFRKRSKVRLRAIVASRLIRLDLPVTNVTPPHNDNHK